MSNFDTNKYRIKFPKIGTKRAYTKAYPRVETIESVAEFLVLGKTLHAKTFDNKKISPQHRKALVDCARLWNELTKFEKAVKERVKKQKARE